ncbi:MAG: DUF1501 domain-containing protein [Planctomyces sp.]|nr:DUF1501 domain-containing protein [Planctomyces sp.]
MSMPFRVHGTPRRNILQAGALAISGLSLGNYLRLAAAGEVRPQATARAAIFINLRGGPSHLDTFDPKPDAADVRGEFEAIPTALPGVHFSEHLPKLARCADQFALLRGVTHSLAAHELGTAYVNTGNRPLPSLEFPGYGAVAAKELTAPRDLPPFVAIPNTAQRAGYLGIRYAPLSTTQAPIVGRPFQVRGVSLQEGVAVSDVERRTQLLSKLDRTFQELEGGNSLIDGLDEFSRQALSVITSPRTQRAFDISREPQAFAAPFGKTPFGGSCLLALRLVEAGVPFVTVTHDGWDTHNDNFEALRTRLLPPFDEGLSALLGGLAARGLLETTAVFVTGEFGRTPRINSQRSGRDHFPRCMFMLLAGGGVRPGQVLGESDATASGPLHEGYSPDDVAATFFHLLGIDHRQEYQTNTGRPVMIVRDGEVIRPLLA